MKSVFSMIVLVVACFCGCTPTKDVPINKVEQEIKTQLSDKTYSWEELSYEEYLQEAQAEKGLSESDLRSLKHMGFTREEIQAMTPEEARHHIDNWVKFAIQKNDERMIELFEEQDQWKEIATREQFVWSDGVETVNSQKLHEFIENMNSPCAYLTILYGEKIYDIDFHPQTGVRVQEYSADKTKKIVNCTAIKELEAYYLLEGIELIIYK